MTGVPQFSCSLPISETFTSIQGEGKLTGVPSFFIRVSGCNLRCSWCDTPYASWEPESGNAPRAVDDLLTEARASGVRHAVLTGGEPLIFAALPILAERLAAEVGMHTTIETAGSTLPPATSQRPAPAAVSCNLISISPKLASSTPRNDPRDPTGAWARRHEERRINIPVLQQLLDTHDPARHPDRDRQLKFVVTHAAFDADLAEIHDLLSQLRGWKPSDVLLMPEGVTTPAAPHRQAVLNACLRHGWRYSARLHIELFGHTRGT